MKKVLIISYHFPPDAAIGAVRPAEIAKCLPDIGWRPLVLSVHAKYYEQLDPLRYRNLSADVWRTAKVGSINSIYIRCKAFLHRFRKSPAPATRGKEWFDASVHRESLRARALRYYNALLIYLPDKEIGWLFFSVHKALTLIKEKQINAILTTSPPHSVQLTGLILKFLTGRVWVADFRDPWEVQLKPDRSRSKLSDLIEKRMERAIVRHSDWVVSVTDPMTRRLQELYPNFRGKFITVPNGYDSEELARYLEGKRYSIFTISYVGSLYFGRCPLAFLTAVAELLKEGRFENRAIRIRFIGDCRTSDGRSVEDMVSSLGLNDITTFIDAVPQEQALKEIARSHVLLLMAPCQPLQIPGKVYEYIGLRAFILAVCQDGATKDLLKTYSKARSVQPGNVAEMKSAILSLHGCAYVQEGVDAFPYEKYERTTIARAIAVLLDRPSKEVLHDY